MSKSRRFLWLIGGLILTGALLLLWRFWPRPRLLLERAHYLSSTQEDTEYYWIDDQTLLLYREPNRHEWKFSQLNLSTGRETDLVALNHLLKDSFVYHGQLDLLPDKFLVVLCLLVAC